MQMHLSEQGLALIRRFEGFCASQYLCPAGKSTIGYGHVIGAGEAFPEAGISEEQAENLLRQDIAPVEVALRRLAGAVNQHQFDALGSFTYNVGIEAFEKSTLLRLLTAGKIPQAAGEFGRWAYAGGKRLEGLARRRAAEAALFMEPE